jgi:xanthine dehydrogenase accessory factor
MNNLIKEVYTLLSKGEDVAQASVVTHSGSTPRTSGAKMIVRSDGGIIGTVGGGLMEAEVIKAATEIFKTGKTRIMMFDLSGGNIDDMDMICGGRVRVVLELIKSVSDNINLFKKYAGAMEKGQNILVVARLPEQDHGPALSRVFITDDLSSDNIYPLHFLKKIKEKARKQRSLGLVVVENQQFLVEPGFVGDTVYLFGAGHVSQKLASLTEMTNFRTVVLDDRAEFASRSRFEHADDIRALDSFDNAFSGLEINNDSYIVILTRGHTHDKTVLAQALKTKAGYIGMIGSHRKRDAIYKKLLVEGFSVKDFNRVHSPIGLEIKAETPEEIGVSIIAELILVRAQKSG